MRFHGPIIFEAMSAPRPVEADTQDFEDLDSHHRLAYLDRPLRAECNFRLASVAVVPISVEGLGRVGAMEADVQNRSCEEQRARSAAADEVRKMGEVLLECWWWREEVGTKSWEGAQWARVEVLC